MLDFGLKRLELAFYHAFQLVKLEFKRLFLLGKDLDLLRFLVYHLLEGPFSGLNFMKILFLLIWHFLVKFMFELLLEVLEVLSMAVGHICELFCQLVVLFL